MNGLSRLLDLGHRLRLRDITLRFDPPVTIPVPLAIGASEAALGDDREGGSNGRSPWLLLALMDDRSAGNDTAVDESMAKLGAAFVHAHARVAA